MTGIYSQRKIVPIADHDKTKQPIRLFAKNMDGSLVEVDMDIQYSVGIKKTASVIDDRIKLSGWLGDVRELFVEVE